MPSTDELTADAYRYGVEVACAAASWTIDGNSDRDVALRTLAMLEDGDPALEDYLPAMPNLSGEWADDPTPLSLARDLTGDDDPDPDTIDALVAAFEAGANDTFHDACEAELRAFVAE